MTDKTAPTKKIAETVLADPGDMEVFKTVRDKICSFIKILRGKAAGFTCTHQMKENPFMMPMARVLAVAGSCSWRPGRVPRPSSWMADNPQGR